MATHKEHLLSWFRRGLSITPAEAVDQFNNYRLADTVYQLREAGHMIRTETMERINSEGRRVTYARYHWIAGPKGETPDSAGVVPTQSHPTASEREGERVPGLWAWLRNWLK